MTTVIHWWQNLSWGGAFLALLLAYMAVGWGFIFSAAAYHRRHRPMATALEWDSFAVRWRNHYVVGAIQDRTNTVRIERVDGRKYGFGQGETAWCEDYYDEFIEDLLDDRVEYCRP